MAEQKSSQTTPDQSNLHELESYVAELESFISEPVAILNTDGVITDANRAFANKLATDQSTVIGKQLTDLIIEGNPFTKFNQASRTNGPRTVSDKVSLTKGDNPPQPTKIRLREWQDKGGDLRGYLLSITTAEEQISKPNPTDSDQSKAEQIADDSNSKGASPIIDQVKEQQMRTQSVLYNITDGLIFLNADNCVEMVNPSAATLLDVHASDLIGEHIDELKNNKVIDELRKFISENEELNKKELSIGAEAYFEVTIVNIGQEQSRQRVVILHDISEKRKIEEMKLEFASVAAHQMRTPLSSIRWSFEILSKRLEDEDLINAAERGYKSTEQVLEVVDELLNVDRLEEGDSGYDFESLDLVVMLDELVETETETGAVVDQPDIHFEKPVDSIPKIRGDEMKLKIVFKNLIDNALKYTDSDAEVRIRVNIKMTSGYGGDVVVAEIEDQGIGIPEGSQDQIFSKFYRADNATDMQTEGTGVGLFITKEIVEAHNGEIWFESTEGEGTTFYVQLPMASDN